MRKIAILGVAVAALSVSACATKRYPIATEFTAAEANLMTCDQLELELVRAHQVRAQIADTAQTDWRSVAGFLGDYGIGNAMARSDADQAVSRRISDIHAAKANKQCAGSYAGS